MASAQGIKAGSAYVEVLVNDSKLVTGLNNAAKRLKNFGSAISSLGTKLLTLGGAVSAPLAAMGKAFASSGAHLFDMSKRTGLSAEALSELSYAAQQTGADIESLEAGTRKMQRSIFSAANGSQAAAEAFSVLGVDLKQLVALNPEQQFSAIADALSQIKDPTLKAALAMQIFGRNGTALLPMMERGAAGLEEFRKHARALGLTFSTQDATAAKALDDAFTDLTLAGKKLGVIIGSALADTLRRAAQTMTNLIVAAGRFVNAHKQIIVTVFKVASAVVGVGAGLLLLGTIITKIGAAFSLLSSLAIGAASALGFIGSVMGLLLSPTLLVVAAVAALGAYLMYTSGVGAKALAWLGQRFSGLKEEALKAWQGIGDALAAGDIGLVARILWLTLKLEWDKGIAALEPVWLEFKTWFLKITYGAFYGALATWEIVQHSLSVAWIETTSFLAKTWTNFTSSVQSAWESVQNWLEDRWHDLFALFDKTYDAKAAKALADRLSQAEQQRIEQNRKGALSKQEQDRSAQRQSESQQHDAALAQIGSDYEKTLAQTAAANADKIKAAQDAVQKARSEWEQAIEDARKKRQSRDANDDLTSKVKAPPNLKKKFAGLADLLNQKQQHTFGVAGTFNALQARGLGAGGVADRIAKAAEQTAQNTKKLLDEMQNLDDPQFE